MQISTQPVQPNDRDDLAKVWLRQRDHTGRAPLPCKWHFPRLCETEEAPHSWSAESLAAFRANVEGRSRFAVGKPIELAEFAEHTWWLKDMQLATGLSLQQKVAGLLVAQARTFEKMWRYFSIFLEARGELIVIENAWDLAHVGFRVERGIQAVVPLEGATPAALSLIDWGTCQRRAPSSIQAKLARWKLHVFARPRLAQKVQEYLPHMRNVVRDRPVVKGCASCRLCGRQNVVGKMSLVTGSYAFGGEGLLGETVEHFLSPVHTRDW